MFHAPALRCLQMSGKFKCECELCVNNIERDDKELDALLEPFKNEPNPAYDRDYEKAREYLKEAWDYLNNQPATVIGYSPHMLQTIKVLEAIAYQIAYPFYPPEPELF